LRSHFSDQWPFWRRRSSRRNPDLASFFVAENPNATGNLGGLAGADQICQTQAQAIGGRAAQRTWHTYLSQEQRGTTPASTPATASAPAPGTT
jgi:hypothetical protein